MLKNKLKSFRHKNEMNQTEFAEYIGVNYGLYNRWENHKVEPSLEWYYKCSKKLNCTINDLLEEVPD